MVSERIESGSGRRHRSGRRRKKFKKQITYALVFLGLLALALIAWSRIVS